MTTGLPDLMRQAQANEWARTGRARQLRLCAGLTQRQVGDYCGVTGTAVAHWEANTRVARGAPGRRWARLLHELAGEG